MKKGIKLFLAILLGFLLVFSFTSTARADAGWDADYDYDYGGGGGWDYGGGNDWDWGNDYDNDYDYGGTNGGGTYIGGSSDIILIIVIVMILIAVFKTIKNSSNYTKTTRSTISTINTTTARALSVEEVQRVIPDFNYNQFKSQVFEIYKQIQVSWMNFDYDTLRKFTTDELYNTYHSELIALNLKKQRNIMKDFEMVNFKITDIEHNENSVSLKVRTTIRCYDYVVDAQNKVVRGSEHTKLLYDYEMTFTKGLGTKNNKCPNCNAPLENVQSSVCPYCDSTIISDNHDWILSKKQMIQQRR